MTERQPERIQAVPVRHPGRWVAAAGILVLAAMLAHTLVTNPNFEWRVVRRYLFEHTVLAGVALTVELTVLAMLIGVALGTVLAVMRLSPNPVVSSASWVYIWFFRGTPVIVQVSFWYFLAALFPHLSFGIPFGPTFVSVSTNTAIGKFTAGAIGLGLNEAAYMAEIVRAGILSVEEGQTEAAQALGMTRLLVLRRIVLPQAMRVVIPPTGNETISMLKTTSIVVIIALTELFTAVTNISAVNFKTIPLLLVAILWYLFMTTVLSIGQYYLERHFARGSARALPPTPLQRLRRNLFSVRHLGLPVGDAR